MHGGNKFLAAVLGGVLAAAGVVRADVDIFGRNHSPIGNATLTANSDGTLTVGNLGSAGNDGVEVDLSDAPPNFQWVGEFGGTNPLASPGAFTTLKSIGMYNGAANTVGAVLTIAANTTGGANWTATFPEGDPDYPVVVKYELDGAVVAADDVNGNQVSFSTDNPPKKLSVDPNDIFLQITVDGEDEDAVAMQTIDGENVMADEIDIFGPYTGTWTQESADWLAGGSISSFTISNEEMNVLPEPAAMLLLPLGVIAGTRRRRA